MLNLTEEQKKMAEMIQGGMDKKGLTDHDVAKILKKDWSIVKIIRLGIDGLSRRVLTILASELDLDCQELLRLGEIIAFYNKAMAPEGSELKTERNRFRSLNDGITQ